MSDLPIHRDFSEFLSLLNEHAVRYLVVGAYAVAANGRPRFTSDLDVLIEPTKANAKRVIAALDAFGFPRSSFRLEDFAAHDRVVMGVAAPVPGREDLIRTKRASGRPKDLLDVALLEESIAEEQG